MWMKRVSIIERTIVELKAFGKILYQGFIRGGQTSEQTFWEDHVCTQAFFVHEQVLAARGQGGGITLWVKTGS